MTEEEIDQNNIKVLIFIIFCAIVFAFFYVRQERGITKKLNECSFFTVLTPVRMPSSNQMYFSYYYNYKRYEGGTSVGPDDIGYRWSNRSIMNNRYWVQVYCKDFEVTRVRWEYEVPDTLQYIPANGWDKIPYGLDKLKE